MTKDTLRARTEKSWRELCERKRPAPAVEWPFPPARLTDRLIDPDRVLCPTCGRVASFRRSWCSHCGVAM